MGFCSLAACLKRRTRGRASVLVATLPLLGACSSKTSDASEDSDGDAMQDASENIADAGDSRCQMTETRVANDGAAHVDEGSELEFTHNPPASGSHYPVWTRFEAFDTEIVQRGYWVHNLEHGGIVLLHGPSAETAEVQRLLSVYEEIPDDPQCSHKRALLTADPALSDPIAIVAWNHVLVGECVNRERVLEFVELHRGAGPENVCVHGSHVP